MRRYDIRLWWVSLLLVLTCTYAIYACGFMGVFQFDDEANLSWLQFVQHPSDAWLFITSGNAGPLGRPVSLLSFYLFNLADWPDNAAAFFRVNTFIHLLNGALLVWLCSLIGPHLEKRSRWFALLAGTIWLLQPLLVSTSLMAVQRMTSISATFVLAGCISYVLARRQLMSHPRIAIAAMSVGVLVFGILATLAKENGLLLLPYLMVLEYTLLATPGSPAPTLLRRWRLAALWLPCTLAIIFLAWKLPDIAASYSSRSFTLPERLQTESVVLWDYLRLLISPERSALGPFRDDYPVYSELLSAPVLASLVLWLALLGAALYYRRRAPYFAFAVLWFFVGHSMESTVIPLELYFEHRNYLPAAGIAILIATFPWRVPEKMVFLASAAAVVYCLELAFVLWQTTSTWGQPMLAATLWHEEHPGSERATLMLAAEYGRRGDNRTILRLLDETAGYHPNDMGLGMSALYSLCFLHDEAQFRARLAGNLNRLQYSPVSFSAIDALEKLTEHRKEQCNWVKNDDIRTMVSAMMRNRQVMGNNFVRARLHRINATLAWDEREFDIFVNEIEQQFIADPQLSSGLTLVQSYMQVDLWEAAAEKLALVESHKPRHYLQQQLWDKQLKPISDLIQKKRQSLNPQE